MDKKDRLSVGTWINPYRLNYGSPYPVGKSIRDYFSQNVITSVDIGVDVLTRTGAKQPSLEALASIVFMLADFLQVEEGAFAGVGFFAQDDLDTDQGSFVGEYLDELSVRDIDEVLVGAPTQADFLLPAVILAEDERRNVILQQSLDNQL